MLTKQIADWISSEFPTLSTKWENNVLVIAEGDHETHIELAERNGWIFDCIDGEIPLGDSLVTVQREMRRLGYFDLVVGIIDDESDDKPNPNKMSDAQYAQAKRDLPNLLQDRFGRYYLSTARCEPRASWTIFTKDEHCGRGDYADEIDVLTASRTSTAEAKRVCFAALLKDYVPGLRIARVSWRG